MSLLTPTATKGQPFFEGASGLRQHDNASDNMVAGAYSHNPLEGSATEADEWTSILLYLFQVAKAGGGAIAVRNTTGSVLNAGPVKILTPGYDAANSAFLIGAADAAGANAANALLLASLPNNTNGVAYLGGSFVGAIDTSASTIGNPVYLAAGGGMTLTAPTGADQIQQIVGRVQVLANPGTVAGLVLAPVKIGTSFHQALSITNALIANTTIDLTAKVTGQLPVPNGGTGAASLGTSKQPILGNGSGALTSMAAPAAADASADAIAGTSAASKKALVLQGSAAQSANIFEIQNSSGITQFAISLGSTTASGPNNTNLGTNAGGAMTSGANNTNVGVGAGSSVQNGSYNTNLGAIAGANISSGANNTILGKNAAATLTTGAANIVLGSDADVPANGSSNLFVAGSPANPVSDVYFGKGVLAAASSPGADWNLNGNGANGSNQTGGNVILAGGKGTGNAEPGVIALKYPLKGASGSTLQSLSAQKFPISACLFTTITSVTLTASVIGATETTIVGSIAGSQQVEGGLFRPGRTLRVRAYCEYTTSAAPPNMTWKMKYGSNLFLSGPTLSLVASQTNGAIMLEGLLVCRTTGSSGTAYGVGLIRYGSQSALSSANQFQIDGGALTVDTTTNQNIDVTLQYSANTAGNSIVCNLLTAEWIN